MTESFDKITGREKFFKLLDQANAQIIDPITKKVRRDLCECISCPLCECNNNLKILFTKDGFDFVQCPDCDLIFINPRLKIEMINSLYTNDETFYSSWTEVILNEANQSWQIPYFKSSLDILDKYIESGDLLDIGCSIGLFMEIAQRRGFNCVGLELEKIAYEHAIGKGLNVHRKKLEEAAFSDESFHVITMFGVLEHLPNPKEILIQVRRCLKPGGVVMAIVPNVYSLAAMMLHDKARLFNGRNHLNYFSWKTLPELFDQTGFITQNLDTYLTGLDSILNYIQYSDPNGEPTRKFLPPQIQSVIDNPDPNLNFEQIMYRLNLGLRLRIVATKPE